jgi:hypothetical protein
MGMESFGMACKFWGAVQELADDAAFSGIRGNFVDSLTYA